LIAAQQLTTPQNFEIRESRATSIRRWGIGLGFVQVVPALAIRAGTWAG
jgi:hypothetical protein